MNEFVSKKCLIKTRKVFDKYNWKQKDYGSTKEGAFCLLGAYAYACYNIPNLGEKVYLGKEKGWMRVEATLGDNWKNPLANALFGDPYFSIALENDKKGVTKKDILRWLDRAIEDAKQRERRAIK